MNDKALRALAEIEKTAPLCHTDNQRHIFIQGYNANKGNSKLDLFIPLAESLSRTQIQNIVESNLNAIKRKRRPKRSLWSLLLGGRLLSTGGLFDLKEFD